MGESPDWHRRWSDNQIGFHHDAVNPLLVKYFPTLAPHTQVFVPLCGKTLDLLWLREQGYCVVGCELVEKAVEDFFTENTLSFDKRSEGDFCIYQCEGISIYCGDYFKLPESVFSQSQGVFDRAAFFALDEQTRIRYAQKMQQLPAGAVNILVTFEYAKGTMTGPPYSVDEAEVQSLYGQHFEIDKVAEYRQETPIFLQEKGLLLETDRVFSLVRK